MKHKLIAFSVSTLVFALLLGDASLSYHLKQFDQATVLMFNDLWSETLNSIMLALTHLSGKIAVPIFTIAIIIYLTFKRKWKMLLLSFFVLAGNLALFSWLKNCIGRMRPESMMYDPSGFAFPSGHAAMSTAMALIVYTIVKPILTVSYQKILVLACISFPLIISLTRVYLNVHYPTDVLAGMAMSFSWFLFVSFAVSIPESLRA